MAFKKLGCLFIFIFPIVVLFCLFNYGIPTTNSDNNVQVIDSSRFSMISKNELVSIMGDPEKVEEYEWKIPRTGEKIVGSLYIYHKGKFEFTIFNDKVARLTVYSDRYYNKNAKAISFKEEKDIFSMFNISITDKTKKITDNGMTLRYSPVSDKVADFWIQEIDNYTFNFARITYNLNYFN